MEFLATRINDPEMKENLQNVMSNETKALNVKAANSLLLLILKQLVINNQEDDEADDSPSTPAPKDDQPTEKISDAEDEDSEDDVAWSQVWKKTRKCKM